MVQQKVLVDRLLTIAESARLVGRSRDWLVRRIRAGRGPSVRKVGPRGRVIKLSDLLAWLDRLEEADGRKGKTLLAGGRRALPTFLREGQRHG